MKTRNIFRCAIVLCLACATVPCVFPQASNAVGAAASSPAFPRTRHLQRGLNLSEWFAQVYDRRGYTREHFETWTTAEDIIKSISPARKRWVNGSKRIRVPRTQFALWFFPGAEGAGLLSVAPGGAWRGVIPGLNADG